MMDWTDYTGANQLPVGEYLWRVPHSSIDSVITIFRAKVRKRGYGCRDSVTSPDFDYWDGWKLHLPESVQYRDVLDSDPEVTIEGVELLPCPFCGDVPKWISNGGYIGARPNQHYRFIVGHCFAEVCRKSPLDAAAVWNTRSPNHPAREDSPTDAADVPEREET